jgi:hypothetical protein
MIQPVYAWIKILVVTVGTSTSNQSLPTGEQWILYNNEIACQNAAVIKEQELAVVLGESAVGNGLRYDVVCKMVSLTEEKQ